MAFLVLSAAAACVGPPRTSARRHAAPSARPCSSSPGTTLDTANYAICGPGGFARSGNIDVSHSQTISFTVGGIPAGDGYSVTISGTASDRTTTCSGSAMFAITPKMTTVLSIKIQCREQPRTGSVQINGTVNVCPVVDAIGASPGEVMVGFASAIVRDRARFRRPARGGDLQLGRDVGHARRARRRRIRRCSARRPASRRSRSRSATATAPTPARVTVVCSPAPVAPALVRINEVESNRGTPGDWVELTNVGGTTADIGGYVFRDNSDATAT